MKITAEQVRRGMVFEWVGGGERLVCTVDGAERFDDITRGPSWPCAIRDRGRGDVCMSGIKSGSMRFLGCDPALAARTDCEQYGIAPGFDAAAHGFARTREGKAHDLRRSLPVGSIYTYDDEPVKERRIVRTGPAFLPSGCTFVGLRADVADWRDGAYLCCGAPNEREGHTLKHITETGKRAVVCTLAIGDHDDHEDIAAGVKWPASPTSAPAFGMFAADVLGLDSNGFRFEDDGGRLRPVNGGLSFTAPAKLTFGTPLSSVERGPHEKLQRFVEREIAVALLGSGAVASPRDPEAPSRSGWIYYMPTGPVFVEDPVPAQQATALPKDPCDSPLPGLYIASRRYACTVHAPTRRGGDLQIDLDVPMHTDAAREMRAEMRAHLEAGRECQLRVGNSTVVGYAVRWTREADPRLPAVDRFTVWFRPSNEQPVPAPQAPKANSTASRDAAVAKAVADVPAGCSAAGWRNVVHVLAADAYERLRTIESWDVVLILASAGPLVAAYERERRAGYGKEQAAKRAAGGSTTVLRLFAAYEAGR